MTVVIACLTREDYAIGSDSGAFEDDTVQKVATPKIWRLGVDGQILVGGAGSYRANEVGKRVKINSILELSLALLDESGDWSMLAVDKTGVFELGDGGHLIRFSENYCATGKAGAVGLGAIGSLYARRRDANLSSRALVTDALKATVLHSPFAAGPVRVLSESL